MLYKIKKNTLVIFLFIIGSSLFSQDIITVESTSLNSPEVEYGPMFYENGLVFSAVDIKNEALTYIDENGKKMTDLFFVPITNNEIGKKSLFSSDLKTSYHDGAITFSADYLTAYFTRTQNPVKKLKNSTKRENKLGVFKAVFDGNNWINIEKCNFNSSEFNYGHPSLSLDGKKLYLISDIDGGYGGKDIYVTEINNGICGPLVNLGPTINSPNNEMFPFIDKSGVLYFSSDREGGIGGLDVYSSNFFNNKWSNPTLLDTTINTIFDDFSLVWNTKGNEGYFSSNRYGSDDIYKINVAYPKFNSCIEIKEEQLCFEFYEEASLNADSVSMKYQWNFGDGNIEEGLEVHHCYKEPGLYIVDLNILDPVIDEVFVNKDVYELEIEEVLQPKIICPDSVIGSSLFNVIVQQGKWNDYPIENIYIDYGDSIITKNDTSSHSYAITGLKELKILITGHDPESNELKMNCFYKFINVTHPDEIYTEVKKNLELLPFEGFNASKLEENDSSYYYVLELLTSSTSVKGDSLILKKYTDIVHEIFNDSSHLFSYILEKTENPFELIERFREVHELGFTNAIVKTFENDNLLVDVEDFTKLEVNQLGRTNITLKDIQFNFEAFELTPNSKLKLNKLVSYLEKNDKIKIEIGAYTDAARDVEQAKINFKNKGLVYSKEAHDKISSNYNLQLSQKRANSVMNYLIENKIDRNRLKAKGYGELNPIDTNETEEGRTKNRRVSFKIVN